MKVAVGKDEPDELAVPAGPFRGAPRRAGGWWKADAMLVTSRSAAEYAAMFDLASEELAHATILDCCAGGSSFVAETATFVVAADPAYAQDRHVLVADAAAGLLDGDRIIEAHADRFEWGWYGDRARRVTMRAEAVDRFAADLAARPSRYVAAALPDLPLADRSFDLVLCSHLLFTWADQFDREWHREALGELVRVSRREVRIFPLVLQGTGEPVAFLPVLREQLHAGGHRTELRRVPYQFHRGADQMLVISVTGAAGDARTEAGR